MAKNKKSDRPTTFWLASAKAFETLADKFGWPGLFVIFVIHMIEYRATDEQRHAIIDMYILGKGIKTLYPILTMGVLFLFVALAQRYWYRRKITLLERELLRVGSEKSVKQETAIGVPLHHASLPERSK